MMQSAPSGSKPNGSKVSDTWSPTIVAVSALYALGLVVADKKAPAFLLVLFAITLLAFISFFVWFGYDLIRKRFRHALSLVVAVVTAIFIVGCAPLISAYKDTLSFNAHLSEYQQQVEQARTRNSTQGPLQIVLDYQDRSPIVTANSFYYIIYDETDGAGPYEKLFWPYAASETGVLAVRVPHKIRNLSGHYYDFTIAD